MQDIKGPEIKKDVLYAFTIGGSEYEIVTDGQRVLLVSPKGNIFPLSLPVPRQYGSPEGSSTKYHEKGEVTITFPEERTFQDKAAIEFSVTARAWYGQDGTYAPASPETRKKKLTVVPGVAAPVLEDILD